MKIVFVLENANRQNNGTTVTCLRFASELRKRGHQVTILGQKIPDDETSHYWVDYAGLDHYPLPIPLFEKIIQNEGFNFVVVDDATIYNTIKDADVVHLFLPFKLSKHCQMIADSLGVAVTGAYHMSPYNITGVLHMGHHRFPNWLIYRSFRNYLFNHVKNIHCPSQMVADDLKAEHYDRNHMWAISNGINGYFHPVEAERPAELKDKFIVTMSGRLSAEKRQDLILRAVGASKYNDKIQVILCGQGPAKARYEQDSVLYRLKNPAIIKFCRAEELRETLNYTDLYVHASDFETEGISCMEALACGAVPIISDSKYCATKGFSLSPECIFKHGKYKSLRDQIDFFYEHPDLRKELSAKYLEYSKQFALQSQVDKMEEFLNTAIEEKKNGQDLPTLYPSKKDLRKERKIFKKLIEKGIVSEMPERLRKK